MDVINSNIVLNISITKLKSDISSITTEITSLSEALKALDSIKPVVKIGITDADIARVRELNAALREMRGGAGAGAAGVGGVGSRGGALSAVGLDPKSIQNAKQGIYEVAKQLHRGVSAATEGMVRPGMDPIGLPVPGTAESVKIRERLYQDKEGEERSIKTESFSNQKINGILRERVNVQQKIVDGKHAEKVTTSEVTNAEEVLKAKQHQRGVEGEDRRRRIEANVAATRKRVSQWSKEGFTEDPFARRPQEEWINGKKVQYQVREFRKELEGGVVAIRKINESTNIMHPRLGKSVEHAREIRRVMAGIAKAARQVREQDERNVTLDQFRQDSMKQGLKSGGVRTRYDTRTGVKTETHQYWSERRRGLAQYMVTLREYNSLTGLVTEKQLTGAEAARFLGDSIFRAGEKVLMWTVSTTILFQAIRVIRALGEEIISLEANTILLARVADKLVSSYGAAGASFEIKRKIAERLTEQIIGLTQAIGGSASEAQKAAAVFLRAGQTEKEVILSVTAALLASKIAEMEVAEASNLLVSAILQFEMAASSLLPTLDSLNTLSNNYKVTTKDLLDSISRAGSVYAAHNGKLEELAGMTAVIAEVTSRTGTQIGNAIKTIQSRLDRVEVKKNLFQRLQVSTSDMTGKARSLSDMLLELQIRMEGLSETEQNELTIQAAGVRQRAIMVSAINEADKIILAYNKALMESGSATTEFGEQAGTIAAALERIKGSFSAIAKSMSTSGGSAMNTIVNLVDVILRTINAFDGLAIKMAGYAGMFYVLRRVIGPLVAVDFAALQASALTTGVSMRLAASSVSIFSSQLGVAATMSYMFGYSLSFVKATLMALLTPLNIATVGLGLVIWAVTEMAVASNTAIDSNDAYTNSINEQISAENKRRDAIVNTINRVSQLAAEIHRLNLIEEAASGPNDKYTERKESIQKYADDFMKSVGAGRITLTDDSGKLRGSAAAEIMMTGIEMENKRMKAELKLLNAQQENLQANLDAAKDVERKAWPRKMSDLTYNRHGDNSYWNKFIIGDVQDLQNVDEFNRYASKVAEQARRARTLNIEREGMTMQEGLEHWRGLSEGDKYILEHSKRIIDQSENIRNWSESQLEASIAVKALEEDLSDLATQMAGLDSELLNAGDLVKLKGIVFGTHQSAFAIQGDLEGLADIAAGEKMTGMSLPFADTDAAVESLGRNIKSAIAGLNDWINMNKGISTKDLEDYIKLVEKGTKVYDKAIKARRDSVRKERVSFAASQFKMRDQLAEAFATNREGTADSNKLLSDTFGFAAIESQMARVADRIKAAKAEFLAMPKLQTVGAYGATNEEKKKFQDEEGDRLSKKVYIQKELLHLRDLEVQKAITLDKAEAQIAESRKKAADEAARALGMLSQQDKIRVLAQAQYFRENPNRSIGPEEVFNTTAAGYKITSQFFNSKLRGFDPNASAYERILSGAGLGMTPEIINSQERLATASDAAALSIDMMNESLQRAIGHEVESRITGGESSIADARTRKSIGYDDGAADQFSINVQRGAVDFSGFGEDFVKILRPMVAEEVESAVNYIRSTRPPQPTRQGLKPAE